MKFLLVLAVAFGLTTGQAQAGIFGGDKWTQEDAEMVSKLLDSFGPGCTLTGGIASDALIVVKSLGDLMKAAALAPECQSLAGAVASLQSAHLQASSIWPSSNENTYSDAEREYLRYKKQKDEILLLLATETDATARQDLKTQLQEIQIYLSGAEGQRVAAMESDRRIRKNEALRILVSSTNVAMDQAIANQSCWAAKPDLLQQLVGLGSTVSYSAAVVAPASGVALAMGAGLQIVGGVMDYFKRLSTAKKISRFVAPLSPVALTCALEKMNQIYCAARDSQSSIDVVAKAGSSLAQDPVWQGITLNRRSLPIVINWLERLRTGSGSVSSPEDAFKIEELEYKKQALQQSPRRFQGYLAKYKPMFLQATSQDTKFGFLQKFIANMSDSFCTTMPGMTSSNPLCSIHPASYVPFYLLGIDSTQYNQLVSKYSGMTFSQVTLQLLAAENIPVTIDIDLVEPRFVIWHDLAKQRFDIESANLLGEDLRLVFEEAQPKGDSDKLRLSPKTALQQILNFLRTPALAPAVPDFTADVIVQLQSIMDHIESVAQGTKTPEDARDLIMVDAKLTSGTGYVQNRVQFSLRQHLEALILKQGDLPLQALAATDYLQELYSFYSADSLEILRRKSLSAQSTIQRSIDPFVEFFETPLKEALTSLDNQVRRNGEGPGGPNYEMKLTLCFYMLGTSRWPSDVDLSICDGMYGKPIFAEGKTTPKFSKRLYDLPYQDRACILRDYVRRNQVLQRKWGFKQKPQKPLQ
ncbi:hypothetical protein [Bdellovibrio sp. HCB337]|uniref:hypothetical protein n=1 Tax=Bdellovibrio sp. HCB337 TaxID=3394358 RepID=UPI0039A57526